MILLKNAVPAAIQHTQGLNEMLEDEKKTREFEKFLASEFAVENLKFLLDVRSLATVVCAPATMSRPCDFLATHVVPSSHSRQPNYYFSHSLAFLLSSVTVFPPPPPGLQGSTTLGAPLCPVYTSSHPFFQRFRFFLLAKVN